MKLSKRAKFDRLLESFPKSNKEIMEEGFWGDEMILWNRCGHFQLSPSFMGAFKKEAGHSIYQSMIWRCHVLCTSAERIVRKGIPGDFIECGVFRGFKSKVLLNYLDNCLGDRQFFLCDTYEGIDMAQVGGSPIRPSDHQKPFLYEFVLNRFSEFSRARVIKGSCPTSLETLNIESLSFIHLDMNSAQAEISTLDVLWDRLSDGGVLILDDFGLSSHREQCFAHRDYFNSLGVEIMELPTAQGLIYK